MLYNEYGRKLKEEYKANKKKWADYFISHGEEFHLKPEGIFWLPRLDCSVVVSHQREDDKASDLLNSTGKPVVYVWDSLYCIAYCVDSRNSGCGEDSWDAYWCLDDSYINKKLIMRLITPYYDENIFFCDCEFNHWHSLKATKPKPKRNIKPAQSPTNQEFGRVDGRF